MKKETEELWKIKADVLKEVSREFTIKHLERENYLLRQEKTNRELKESRDAYLYISTLPDYTSRILMGILLGMPLGMCITVLFMV